MALTFPNAAVCDTEHKAYVVMRKFGNKRWFPATSMEELRLFVDTCLSDPNIETVVIDSGSDVQDWAEQEYIAEKGVNAIYPQVEYKKVYRKIDEITYKVIDGGKNLVLTSRVKDEWIADSKTGRLIRDSYKKYPFQLQLIIMLEKGIRDYKGVLHFKDYVFGRVIKNGYAGTTFSKPYLINCSYQGILDELMEPYFEAGETEEDRKDKWEQMITEAEKAIRGRPPLKATREGPAIRKDQVPGI